MKLTGKDVLDASYAPQRVPAQTWDALSEVSHARLTGIADVLNASHIAPLQGEIDALKALVHDYYEFNKGDAPRLRAPYRVWDADRNALQAYAAKLLKEEE